MTEDKIVYEIQKRTDEKIIFSLAEFKGKKYVHIRTWIEDGDGWVRTQKGICIPVDQVEELMKGVSALVQAVGIAGPGGEVPEYAQI